MARSARAVNTIQTGFVLSNKTTRETEAMKEEDNGVVASSDSATTKSVAGHEVIEPSQRSTTDAARRERVRRDPQAKTTGHAEQAVGHKVLGASRRSGEPERGVALGEREGVSVEDGAGLRRRSGIEGLKQARVAEVGEDVLELGQGSEG
jgi:hypothetical protein